MGTSKDEAVDIGRALGNFNSAIDKAATGSSTDLKLDAGDDVYVLFYSSLSDQIEAGSANTYFTGHLVGKII